MLCENLKCTRANNSIIGLDKKKSKFEYKIDYAMTAVAIRKKIVNYLEIADDKKVKAIYALLEDDIEQRVQISIEQYNKELAEAEAEFANGDFISNTAMKKKIKQW